MSDIEQLAQVVELHGRDIVDIGCGDGAFVRALAKAGANPVGIEVSEAAVERASTKDPGNRYLLGSAEAIPLPDASVDVAVLMRSLHHVPDPNTAFPELRRVVRDLVYIAEPLATGEFFELIKSVDDETEVRAKAQQAIADATGFERLRTIEYEVTISLASFEALRDRVLAADPGRAERFATLEADLRTRFTPGDYTVPMRADLLRSAGS